eukprot:CAMPEP_0181246486 /NCGR_PEP_ID=MMETSP1096-20121128/44026_1 /TAXON_ID=156174 ORGANISM="Chrysochromulina ericina, Strain CCMP281" /NCGR_SAMPLE_ID=MMETSP1096 /ASSEMBLY_ACC=CAM_ASM_000453 /LENGTH=286 /DNA_ID=CAMNT_0023343319 /DNA_START=203 /DNA_END=1065 /DNA_ORIENTATION=-
MAERMLIAVAVADGAPIPITDTLRLRARIVHVTWRQLPNPYVSTAEPLLLSTADAAESYRISIAYAALMAAEALLTACGAHCACSCAGLNGSRDCHACITHPVHAPADVSGSLGSPTVVTHSPVLRRTAWGVSWLLADDYFPPRSCLPSPVGPLGALRATPGGFALRPRRVLSNPSLLLLGVYLTQLLQPFQSRLEVRNSQQEGGEVLHVEDEKLTRCPRPDVSASWLPVKNGHFTEQEILICRVCIQGGKLKRTLADGDNTMQHDIYLIPWLTFREDLLPLLMLL